MEIARIITVTVLVGFLPAIVIYAIVDDFLTWREWSKRWERNQAEKD